MKEIRYTYAGVINADFVASTIIWVSNQIFDNVPKKLKLFISSTGGDVDSAIRLHDYLKATPLTVETIGFGQIDSAANTVFLAGTKRSAIKNCRFFLHEGTFTVAQQTSALHVHEETIRLLQALRDRHVQILAEGTGHTTEDMKKMLRDGIVLSDRQAKEFGLVHEIITKIPPREDLPVAMSK